MGGMHLSFQLGVAYEKAKQGQNVTEFNTLVDEYNAWIRQHFGEDANLSMSKINEIIPNKIVSNETIPNKIVSNDTGPNKIVSNDTGPNKIAPNETTPSAGYTGLKNPFKAGSDLSKFGKQQVYDL
jgi:hypothetical protein